MFVYREEYYLTRAEPARRAEESDQKFNERHEGVAAALRADLRQGRGHRGQAAPWPHRHRAPVVRRPVHASSATSTAMGRTSPCPRSAKSRRQCPLPARFDDAARRAGAILTDRSGRHRGQLARAARCRARHRPAGRLRRRCSRPTPTAPAPPWSARGWRPRAAGSSSWPISTRASRCARVLPEPPIYVLNGLLPGTEADFVEHRLTPGAQPPGAAQQLARRRPALQPGRSTPSIHHRHRPAPPGFRRRGGAGARSTSAAGCARLRLALIMSHLVASEEHVEPGQRRAAFALPHFRARACRARRPRSPTPRASSWVPTTISTCCARAPRSTASIPCPARPNPMLTGGDACKRTSCRPGGSTLSRRWATAAPGVRRGRAGSPRLRWGMPTAISVTSSTAPIVHLAGHRVPVIGRISMDLVTIDVTDVPEADCAARRHGRGAGSALTPTILPTTREPTPTKS